MIIGIGDGIIVLDYLYIIQSKRGYTICAMDIHNIYLNQSIMLATDLLYLNGKEEDYPYPNLFGSLDMQTFEQKIIPLIQDRVKGVVGEVIYIMCYLGYDLHDRILLEAAKAGKERGKIVVAHIDMPMKCEGLEKTILANNSFVQLQLFVDTFFVFYRDTFEEDNPNIYESFSPLELAVNTFRMPYDVIHYISNQKGEIIIDESDVKTLLKSGAFSAVGIGQSKLPDRISTMVAQVLDSPYLKYLNKEKCKLILLSFEASEQNAIRMEEIEEFKQRLHEHYGEEVDMIIGFKQDNILGELAKVVCLFSSSEHELLYNL
jgi:cell division GTPase FtsZ